MSDRNILRRRARALFGVSRLSGAAVALAGAAIALAGAAEAQTNLYTKIGDKHYDRLGASVRLAGDVNGDGKPDFVTGAPENGNLFGPGEGFARVFSGATGSTLYTFDGAAAEDAYGTSVDSAGDVNNDGRADLIIGAPLANNLAGRAYVRSGLNGAILYTFDGGAGDQLGHAVAGIGDVNNDGFADVLAASPFAQGGGVSRGMARIYSGQNGSVLTTINGTVNNARLGVSADAVGDVNADGRPDFIVGSYFAGAKIYSGMNFSVLRTFTAPSADDRLGFAVAGCGQADTDGVPDVIVGATQDGNPFAAGSGYAKVYSGATGAVIHTLTGASIGDRFGCSVAGARDMDGDGRVELLVGADQDTTGSAGYARLFRGSDATVLLTFDGIAGAVRCGASVDSLGDIEGNGSFEVLVASPNRSFPFTLNGRLDVWSVTLAGTCPSPFNFCSATNNSTGQPALMSNTGTTSIAANNLVLRATGCPNNTSGLFFYGPNQIQQPFGNGFRCVGGSVWRLSPIFTSPTGVGTHPINYNMLPPGGQITSGSTWKFQFWYRNPAGGGAFFNLTDGLSITFCN